MKSQEACWPTAGKRANGLFPERVVPNWAVAPDAVARALSREGRVGDVERHLHRAWTHLASSPSAAVEALARAEEAMASLSATVPRLILASLAAEVCLADALLALVLGNPGRARERLRDVKRWEGEAADPHLDALQIAAVALVSVASGESGRALAAARVALEIYENAGVKAVHLGPYRRLVAYLTRERYGLCSGLEDGPAGGEEKGGTSGEPFEDPDLFVNCLRAQSGPEGWIEKRLDPDWEAL